MSSTDTENKLAKDLLTGGKRGGNISHHQDKAYRDIHRKMYPHTTPLPKPDKGTLCFICGRDDHVFPSMDVVACPMCMKSLFPSAITACRDDIYLDNGGENCYLCGRRKIRMYKVSGRICQKDTIRIAENVREYKKHQRRRFRFQ